SYFSDWDPDEHGKIIGDGFDMDHDGKISGDEHFTATEEWWFLTNPNNPNSDGDVTYDEKKGTSYYLNDGTEVYIYEKNHPELYKNPTVGLVGNGGPNIAALAMPTRKTDAKYHGCKPDYLSIKL